MNSLGFLLAAAAILLSVNLLHASAQKESESLSTPYKSQLRAANRIQGRSVRGKFGVSDKLTSGSQANSRRVAIRKNARRQSNLAGQEGLHHRQSPQLRARHRPNFSFPRTGSLPLQSRTVPRQRVPGPKRPRQNLLNRSSSAHRGSRDRILDVPHADISQDNIVRVVPKFNHRTSSSLLNPKDNVIRDANSTSTPLQHRKSSFPQQKLEIRNIHHPASDLDNKLKVGNTEPSTANPVSPVNKATQDYLQRIFNHERVREKLLNASVVDRNTLVQAELLLKKITGTLDMVTYNLSKGPIRIDENVQPTEEAFEYGPLDVQREPSTQVGYG